MQILDGLVRDREKGVCKLKIKVWLHFHIFQEVQVMIFEKRECLLWSR
jgi:hypothetical protein